MADRRINLGSAEIDALSRMAWAEAEGEPVEGQLATVAVALNRAAAGRRDLGGTDIISVLNYPGAFTPVTRAGGVDRLEQPPRDFAARVAEFVAGFSPATDMTKGATFFAADGSNPYQSHLTIGNHSFYKGFRERVDVPAFQVEVAAPALQTFGIEAKTQTAQTAQAPATGPILTDETSLLTPYADGGTARLSQIAGITPPARPTDLASPSEFAPPIRNTERIVSDYGWRNLPGRGRDFHEGIDIARTRGEIGTAVYAMEPGEVIEARTMTPDRIGRVRVRQDDGSVTTYFHVDPDRVQVGDRVAANQMIAAIPSEVGPQSQNRHLDVRKQRPDGSWIDLEPQIRAAWSREQERMAQARPPAPTQAVAARARNPANMTAFAEPPEPAQRPTRVAAAAPVTMTDVAQTARPAARQVVSSGMTPATAYAPASPPSTAPSRTAAPSYAPDVTQGMTRGNRFGDGALGLRGPESALAMRGATNLGGVTTSALPGSFGEFNDFSRLINTPQAQARTNPMGARSPRAMGAEDIAAPSAPSTFPARPAPGGPGAYPASAAARPVRTEIVAAVPGTIAGAFPAPAAPPSRPVAPPAPPPRPAPAPARAPAPAPALTTAPALAAAPLPPERPAFLPNNPNAPRGVQMFERGAAGIGNFVERNTRGLRNSLNERYGDYYGGNMFAPNYNTGDDIIDFINMDAAMRGPGAPNLFDAFARDFGNMSRGGLLGGSTIGGMVAGPPGALVGGLLGGIVGEQMGFGRDRGEARQNESRSLLDAIGDLFGGLGGLGGTDLGGESRDSDNGSRRGGGFGTPEPGMGIGGDNWA